MKYFLKNQIHATDFQQYQSRPNFNSTANRIACRSDQTLIKALIPDLRLEAFERLKITNCYYTCDYRDCKILFY